MERKGIVKDHYSERKPMKAHLWQHDGFHEGAFDSNSLRFTEEEVVESGIESGYGRLDVVVYLKEKRYGRYGAMIFERVAFSGEKALLKTEKQSV